MPGKIAAVFPSTARTAPVRDNSYLT